MKGLLKRSFQKVGLLPPPWPSEHKLIDGAQACCVKRFGPLHPDKTFYVIRQEGGGRGLFSLVASVLCHLDIADKYGWIPVVDFLNFKCVYNEDNPVNGSLNAWENYFEPVSQYRLDDVYDSANVIFSDNGYPYGYDYSITTETSLHAIYKKYINVKPLHRDAVDEFCDAQFHGFNVLGVHFRGQEMQTAAGHPFPPTKHQMCIRINRLINDYGFNKVFVVSEDDGYVDFLSNRFGGVVVANNHYRTEGKNAYEEYPREQHMYQLGREVLVDALLLSRCGGLLACGSNVSTFSRFVNNGRFRVDERISNGTNTSNFILRHFLWRIKAALPASLGFGD